MHLLRYTCTQDGQSRVFVHKFATYHQAEDAMLKLHIDRSDVPWDYSDWSIDGNPISPAHLDFLVDELVCSALGYI